MCPFVCVASRDHVLVMFIYPEPSTGWKLTVSEYLANELVDRSLDERMGGLINE